MPIMDPFSVLPTSATRIESEAVLKLGLSRIAGPSLAHARLVSPWPTGSGVRAIIGVKTGPGCTKFTRIPYRAYSTAATFVIPRTANLGCGAGGAVIELPRIGLCGRIRAHRRPVSRLSRRLMLRVEGTAVVRRTLRPDDTLGTSTRATSGFSKLRRTEAAGCTDRLSRAISRSVSAVVAPLCFSREAAE